MNRTGWSNEKYDELIANAKNEAEKRNVMNTFMKLNKFYLMNYHFSQFTSTIKSDYKNRSFGVVLTSCRLFGIEVGFERVMDSSESKGSNRTLLFDFIISPKESRYHAT